MKVVQTLAGLGFIVISLVCLYLAATSLSDVPGLVATADEIDLGDLEREQVIPARFEVTNATAQKVKLLRVRATCSCVVAKPSKWVLDPGEGLVLNVRYKAGREFGPLEQLVFLEYATGVSTSYLTVRFRANIVATRHE